mmetsp:Transcript_14916/g.64552  ORF Transcript_14916/g.64552 Transcript_14916/m.64552 type:complete len:277 (+) Transcript_14916:222-1052(+)
MSQPPGQGDPGSAQSTNPFAAQPTFLQGVQREETAAPQQAAPPQGGPVLISQPGEERPVIGREDGSPRVAPAPVEYQVTHTQFAPQPMPQQNMFYPSVPHGSSAAAHYGHQYGHHRQAMREGGGYVVMMPDGRSVTVSEDSGSLEMLITRQYSRALRIFAFIDILLCILYTLSGWTWAIFAVVGPICGYYGAKHYHTGNTLIYLTFCFLNLIMRCALLVMSRGAASIVLTVLMVMVEVYITRLVIIFYRLLKSLSDEDLTLLRVLDNAAPVRPVYY